MTLGETIWRWEGRRMEREIDRFKPGSIVEAGEETTEDVVMDDVQEVSMPENVSNVDIAKATEEGLEGLLPANEVAVIMAALGTLELEAAVNELLERNRRALARLEELQDCV